MSKEIQNEQVISAKTIHIQNSPYTSPWRYSQRVKMFFWDYSWLLFCSWTPKPANGWRLLWLKLFGCKIYGKPFVHQRARINIPWNLTLHDHASLGDRTNVYSLGRIEIQAHATVAQEAYLCTGTHAFDKKNKNLITEPIFIGANSFIGARAFILPGVTIGANAIIGACSVVTKDVDRSTIMAGNPAKIISIKRVI